MSDMQFGTKFFWYQFSVTNRTVLCFCAGLWYRFSGTGFRHQFLVHVSLALGMFAALLRLSPSSSCCTDHRVVMLCVQQIMGEVWSTGHSPEFSLTELSTPHRPFGSSLPVLISG